MSETRERMEKALRCLYIAVDATVADDVTRLVHAAMKQVTDERDQLAQQINTIHANLLRFAPKTCESDNTLDRIMCALESCKEAVKERDRLRYHLDAVLREEGEKGDQIAAEFKRAGYPCGYGRRPNFITDRAKQIVDELDRLREENKRLKESSDFCDYMGPIELTRKPGDD